MAIPSKRVPPPRTFYLERDEVNVLFAGLPNTGKLALRDRALLMFLYNTGARVQEIADLKADIKAWVDARSEPIELRKLIEKCDNQIKQQKGLHISWKTYKQICLEIQAENNPFAVVG